MRSLIIFFVIVSLLSSCNWARKKTKETVNKSGEIVAKTGSEFVDGMSRGIEKTFENEVVISKELKAAGMETGRILILGTDTTTDNILSVYIIFNDDFNREVGVKAFDDNDKEYGRVRTLVAGQKDDARYVDFVFDARTNLDGTGRLLVY